VEKACAVRTIGGTQRGKPKRSEAHGVKYYRASNKARRTQPILLSSNSALCQKLAIANSE
jgi:hypothetical protein